MRRILSLVCLFPVSVLTVFCYIGYANVFDTMSMKMGAGIVLQVAFWVSVVGVTLLFIGILLRFLAARWLAIASLLSCALFTVFSLVTYPVNDSAHDGPALSRSPQELYVQLFVILLLMLLAVLAPRIRLLIAQHRRKGGGQDSPHLP